MRLRTLLLASGALLLALACDKKKEEPTPPAPVTPKIEIPSESQAVFSQGISIQAGTLAQSQTVKFSTTAAWSADVADTKASTWLSVQPTSGSAGTVNMTVTAQPNTGAEGREASVTIKCGTVTQKFTVKQAGNPSATVAVESVSLDKTELTLEPGKSETLNATVKPDNATDKTVTWSTSDATVATVADGKVKAVKAGTATITAKAGEKEATCKVTVKKAEIAVESVTLDKTELTLEPGKSETLTATIKPDNATDKTVTWSTSNAEVATVDNGKVTAVKVGEAVITAKAGDKEATCKVTVKKADIAVESVTLDKTELTLEPGNSEALTATVSPENATDKTVTWSTSNAEVATVEDGKVTAVAEGEALIKAKAGEKEATCKVTVKKADIAVESVTLDKTELTLEPGKSEILTATVMPDNATDKTITWSTSNAEVATIENGKVTAVAEGEALIKAKAGEKEATCKVTVKKAIIAVESVTLDKTELTLEPGVSETLIAVVAPETATDKTVTWSTSDGEVATVEDGRVTALSEGEAIITAKAGDKEATCKVTVKKTVIAVESVTLDKTELTLEPGKSEALTATVKPDNATDKTVSWSTSDASLVSVTQEGLVTARKSGKVTITAVAGEHSASCEVTVTIPVQSIQIDKSSVEIEVGESITLTATIIPEDADERTVTWESSDINVITVDANGKVTAVKAGYATIYARCGGRIASCPVKVKQKGIGGGDPEGFENEGEIEW